MGTMDSAPSWTNEILVKDSLLFRFVGNIQAYHCPADMSSVSGSKLNFSSPPGQARVRSVTMNGWMNPINSWAPNNQSGPNPVRNFRVLADVERPKAIFLTIDENPSTINDGWIVSDPRNTTSWLDIPATYHEGGSTLSFADGHSELKRWNDPALFGAGARVGAVSKDNGIDLKWFHVRSTY
jgi:prepilin-type processing-associated H-X9-DG protein